MYGWFSDPYFEVLWEGIHLFYFRRGIVNEKCWKVKKKFMCGLPKDIWGQNITAGGGAYSAPDTSKG